MVNNDTETDFTEQETLIQGIPCKELYEKELVKDPDGFFYNEFFDTEVYWICPNVTDIKILNK